MVLLYILGAVFIVLFMYAWVCGNISIHLGIFALNLVLDFYSYSFLLLLFLISSLVLLWSYYYIEHDATYRRFLGLVFCFLSSIFILVFFCSIYGALIGWDGLGVSSFLLVIYFKNRNSLGSGVITAMTNRIGDCFLLVLLALSFSQFFNSYVYTVFLLLISITNSAQFPFSSWLPAAMAAPTPVSALVHSSTLVTAGIYLLIRFNSIGTEWILVVGSVTITIAGLCACAEIDLNNIVALSTLSQLGVMVVALSVNLNVLCFFHLTTHAMFNALLFMSVGIGIHTVYGSQDFRSYATFSSVSALPSLSLTVANTSLAGLPFIAGYYSKDAILESFYNSSLSFFFLIVFLIGVGLTTAYSVKISLLAVLGGDNSGSADLNGGGVGWVCNIPLGVLSLSSVCAGLILASVFVEAGPVVEKTDNLIPLVIISSGILAGYFLSNLNYALFSNMLFLTPSIQLTSVLAINIGGSGDMDRGMFALSTSAGVLGYFNAIITEFRWILIVSLLLCVTIGN